MGAQPLTFAVFQFGNRLGTSHVGLDGALFLPVGMASVGGMQGA